MIDQALAILGWIAFFTLSPVIVIGPSIIVGLDGADAEPFAILAAAVWGCLCIGALVWFWTS